MFNQFSQRLKAALSPSEVAIRRDEQISGVGAETLLRTLSPIIERRLEELTIKLIQAPPDLNQLLDLRAQFAEVHRIKQQLRSVSDLGKEASEALADIFVPKP